MGKRVKVKMTFTIEVDMEAWYLTYGQGETVAELREDVKSYFLNAVQQAPCMDEVEGTASMGR